MDGTGELFKLALASFPANLKPIPVAFPNDRIVDYNGLVDLLLPRFQGEPRFLLLGESFSGPLVFKIASRRLKGLAGVILLNSFVTSPVPRWISFLPLRLCFPSPRRS
jgi:pimeloyl-[acyl-carrier protein] methyl ester esterase